MQFISSTVLNRPVARRAAWWIVGLILLSGVVGGLHRGGKTHPDPDWRAFRNETRYAWEHRTIQPGTPMFGYPPTAFFALWPFTTWSPQPLGLYLFVAVNAAAAIGSGIILRRYWFAGPGLPAHATIVWPVLLTVGHAQHVLQANQFTLWILLLCLGGLTLLMRRRQWPGGFLLGLAACIKVTPIVFLPYLILRGRWKATAGMLLAIILCDIVPSVAFFGADGAIREHRAWLQRLDWYSNRRMIEDPLLRVRRHRNNCSYSIVLARWLRPTPDATFQRVIDGEPPAEVIEDARLDLRPDEYLVLDPKPTPGTTWSQRRDAIGAVPRWRLADLSADAVWLIWAGTLSMAVLSLLIATWKRRRTTAGGPGWTAEAALWMLLMFWPTPMMRDYYLALALPAYLAVWRATLLPEDRSKPARGRGLAIAALAFFPAGGLLAILWNAANWYGLHLATLAALAGATVWAWRSGRCPSTTPR